MRRWGVILVVGVCVGLILPSGSVVAQATAVPIVINPNAHPVLGMTRANLEFAFGQPQTDSINDPKSDDKLNGFDTVDWANGGFEVLFMLQPDHKARPQDPTWQITAAPQPLGQDWTPTQAYDLGQTFLPSDAKPLDELTQATLNGHPYNLYRQQFHSDALAKVITDPSFYEGCSNTYPVGTAWILISTDSFGPGVLDVTVSTACSD